MGKKKISSMGSDILNAFKSLNMFGEGVSFQVNGKSTYDTVCGSLVSILLLIAIWSYAI